MEIKNTKIYIAECGRKYFTKKACVHHEIVCKCWKNPKYKTCITCKFGRRLDDSNGMEHEPQFLETWKQWDCGNPKFDYDIHHTPAHPTADDLTINCPVWERQER